MTPTQLARVWLEDPTCDPDIVEPIVRAYLALVDPQPISVTTGAGTVVTEAFTCPGAFLERPTASALGAALAGERGYAWRFTLTASDVLDVIAALSHHHADMLTQMREHGVDWHDEINDLVDLIRVFSERPGERLGKPRPGNPDPPPPAVAADPAALETVDLCRELAKAGISWALADRHADQAADAVRGFRDRARDVPASPDDRVAEERVADRLISACRNEREADEAVKNLSKRLLATLEGA